MLTLIAVFVITYMLHGRFAYDAHQIRIQLSDRVAAEVFEENAGIQQKITANVSALPVPQHVIGVDEPYSRTNNPDVAFMDSALKTINDSGIENGKAKFQETALLPPFGQLFIERLV